MHDSTPRLYVPVIEPEDVVRYLGKQRTIGRRDGRHTP